MSDARAKIMLDALYAELPRLDCQGKCAESCGPIMMTRVEWARITKRLKCAPKATTLTCPMLVNDRCSVYTIRPTLCRLWGMVESMPCPWGCVPERYLTDAEGQDFLLRAEAISEPDHAEAIDRIRESVSS